MLFINGQEFSKLRKRARKEGILFEDPTFPANSRSLAHTRTCHTVEWKRPRVGKIHEALGAQDIAKSAQFEKINTPAITHDLCSGKCGNNWFVSACCTLARDSKQWQKVMNKETTKSMSRNYHGIYHFKFWQFNKWVDVVIDDLLPTFKGELMFCYSLSHNNYWCPLLEKAYAKMMGDYECLKHCTMIDAIVDFTGGVAQKFRIKKDTLKTNESRDRMASKLKGALANNAYITCPIPCTYDDIGRPAGEGLLKGYTYEFREICRAKMTKNAKRVLQQDEMHLVRMSNPHPLAAWSGDWSESSDVVKSLLRSDYNSMGLHYDEPGEFWMTFEDWLHHFNVVHMCHFFRTSSMADKIRWKEYCAIGNWHCATEGSMDDRAGGGKGNTTFLQNPQYFFTLKKPNDPIALSLEQISTHFDKVSGGITYREIGLHIIKVEDNRIYRVNCCDENTLDISRYDTSRNVFYKTNLPRGRYVVIPVTRKPGRTGSFVVRIYTSTRIKVTKMEQSYPRRRKRWYVVNPVMVTTVNVIRVIDVDFSEEGKAYIKTSCEGKGVKSVEETCTGKNEPVFNFKTIFYRSCPMTTPIQIEAYYRGSLIGTAKIAHPDVAGPAARFYSMYEQGGEDRARVEGKLEVIVQSSTDMSDL